MGRDREARYFCMGTQCPRGALRRARARRLGAPSNVAVVPDDGGDDQLVVSYVMGKTGKRTAVRADPKAVALVRPYLERPASGDDPYVFPMMDRYDVSTPEALVKASNSQNVVVNKSLKAVAEAVEGQLAVTMPKLTFHGARHAWADLARRSGRDLHEIRTAMRHSGLSVTEQ